MSNVSSLQKSSTFSTFSDSSTNFFASTFQIQKWHRNNIVENERGKNRICMQLTKRGKTYEGWKSNLTFEVSKSKTFTTDFTFQHLKVRIPEGIPSLKKYRMKIISWHENSSWKLSLKLLLKRGKWKSFTDELIKMQKFVIQ